MATKQRFDAHPPANSGGRQSVLKPEHIVALHDHVSAQASLEESANQVGSALVRALRAQGIMRFKTSRGVSPTADKGLKRYCYTAAHGVKTFPSTAPT